jgi:hypothetical protein
MVARIELFFESEERSDISEMSVDYQQNTGRYIPVDRTSNRTARKYTCFSVFAITSESRDVQAGLYLKNSVFWDVTPCGYCKNRWSSETSVLKRDTRRNIPEDTILQEECRLLGCLADFVFLRSVRRLLVTASVVPSSPILDTVMGR